MKCRKCRDRRPRAAPPQRRVLRAGLPRVLPQPGPRGDPQAPDVHARRNGTGRRLRRQGLARALGRPDRRRLPDDRSLSRPRDLRILDRVEGQVREVRGGPRRPADRQRRARRIGARAGHQGRHAAAAVLRLRPRSATSRIGELDHAMRWWPRATTSTTRRQPCSARSCTTDGGCRASLRAPRRTRWCGAALIGSRSARRRLRLLAKDRYIVEECPFAKGASSHKEILSRMESPAGPAQLPLRLSRARPAFGRAEAALNECALRQVTTGTICAFCKLADQVKRRVS